MVPLENHTTLWPDVQPELARTKISIEFQVGLSLQQIGKMLIRAYSYSDMEKVDFRPQANFRG